MDEQRPAWVQPGRITGIETSPGGRYLVTIRSATVTFAARNLDQREVVRDLTPLTIISNFDTDRSPTRWSWSHSRTTCGPADR